ncbi:MAG: rhamnulokinase, partial [Muribaculaceae bacterium]|nr:rhamnulokinase [Muribaculaceae bacterium]
FLSLKEFAPFEIECLHVIGGGSQNDFLNAMTADALGIEVIAGPVECTASGNILVQAMSVGEVSGVAEIRKIMAKSNSLKTFAPNESDIWTNAYEKFLQLSI